VNIVIDSANSSRGVAEDSGGRLCLKKGECHETDIFMWVLKLISELSVCALMVFLFFGCLVVEKIISEVLTCFRENTYKL
jgi:hypothetical protein